VPGLRREEVARLAGVSVDWYVRLEQGRPVTPSDQVLSSIAAALGLDGAERQYLTNLARPDRGLRQRQPHRPLVRPGVARMIDRFDRQPAFVLGPGMEVLTGNELAWALLADFPAQPLARRNLLRWVLTDPVAANLYLDWPVIASEMIGVLQLEASAWPQDPCMTALIDELSVRSAFFRSEWSRPHPHGRTSGTKRLRHAVVGPITVDWQAFTLPDDHSQTLFVYTATDVGSTSALRSLAAHRAMAHARLDIRPDESVDCQTSLG
jgi:transcriptional regulator with XRE-family HTH domain